MAIKKTLKKSTSTPTQPDHENPDADAIEEETVEDQNVSPDENPDDADGGDDEQEPEVEATAPAVEIDPEPLQGAPRDGRSFKSGEPVIIEGIQRGGMVLVTKPVYRAARAPGSSRWRYHLLAGRGKEIAIGKLTEIGEKRKNDKEPGQFQTGMENFS